MMMDRRGFLATAGVLFVGGLMPAQQHYWTGSEWLSANKIQAPAGGQTRLFTVPTTSGYRVELGDPTYPIRYWDGTNTKFTLSNTGKVSSYFDATSYIELAPTSAGVLATTYNLTEFDVAALVYVSGRFISMAPAHDSGESQAFLNLSSSATVNAGWANLHGGRVSARNNSDRGLDVTTTTDTMTLDNGIINIGRSGGTVAFVSGSIVEMTEQSAPSTPAANKLRLYAKDAGGVSRLFYKNDGGTEYGPL